MRTLTLTAGLACVSGGGTARAECLTLVSGPVVFDVSGCKQIEPEATFDYSKERFAWIKDLDPTGRKKLLDSYRGVYLKGKIVKSRAVSKGLTGEQGALTGEAIAVFIPPAAGASCQAVNGKRLDATLREICCDGGGDVPCLLGTSYLLVSPQVLGSASSGAGDNSRQKSKLSKDYAAAEKSFKIGKYKDAAKAYEKARVNDELDVKGHYNLGFSYRKLDQCKDAIQSLKYVHDLQSKKGIWADEEPIARKATLLLARCYSKMNEPGAAVLVMQGFLLEPEKYRSEIKQTLSDKDFGWIHTSKEYLDYKKDAQKKLKK